MSRRNFKVKLIKTVLNTFIYNIIILFFFLNDECGVKTLILQDSLYVPAELQLRTSYALDQCVHIHLQWMGELGGKG